MTVSTKDQVTGKDNGIGYSGGKGKNNGGAFGVGGYCVCSRCGKKVAHQKGQKCTTTKCPDCGHVMLREELLRKSLSK